jgi:CheY-like chemotaxis protein
MERRQADAADLVRQAVEVVQGMAAQQRVRIEVEPMEAQIWVDVDRLVQVLTNLLSNAVKFSEPDSVVRVVGERRDGELLLSVVDTGRGIPAEHLEQIFGRFQQVDASDSRAKGGTGLGLAIARSIVQQHGGRIWAESEPGEGSTFTFSIPLQAEPAEEASTPQRSDDHRPLVILCDDDASIRSVVGAQLEQQGYRVRTAASGPEAVAAALEERPGAILLDLMMPDVDGWETMERLKADRRTESIPVIIFSARSPEGGEPLGAAEWVTKASGDATLFGALDRALSGREEPARIILVEDDAHLASVLREFFERYNVQAVHARSCDEAIAASRDRLPDLLVLDLVLRDGAAVDAVECLRRDPRLCRVPLMVYSAADLAAEQRAKLGVASGDILSRGAMMPGQFEERLGAILDQLIGTPEERRHG